MIQLHLLVNGDYCFRPDTDRHLISLHLYYYYDYNYDEEDYHDDDHRINAFNTESNLKY